MDRLRKKMITQRWALFVFYYFYFMSEPSNTSKLPWYKTKKWIFLSLMFCFPLGLFLMNKYTTWPKFLKIVIGTFFGSIAIPSFLFTVLLFNIKEPQNNTLKTQDTISYSPEQSTPLVRINSPTQIPSVTPTGPTSTPGPTFTPSPTSPPPTNTPTPKPQDIITHIVEKKFAGKAYDMKRLTKILVDDMGGSYQVWIGFLANDNLTSNFIRKGIIRESAEVIKELLMLKDIHISQITIRAYLPATDKYGNDTTSLVYDIIFDGEEGYKINWNADETTLTHDIIPNLWKVTIDRL